ncbi:MAG: phosphoribosylformimino-5-aminoimidazole carboxamide ribotide isomerase [Verrucomicrobiales bacterium]|nr:phosphoribosylformimino-5-aminoimidazole carboxamide ribotide isomerase [Verrucomicrobiales bacterium]
MKQDRTKFRPCIDLHEGKVKQIVGGTLTDSGDSPATNFESDKSPAWFANLYKEDGLNGGHVIKLGPGNEEAAKSALSAWPGGLQIGGGITAENAADWLAAGASHVILTSYLFDKQGRFLESHLDRVLAETGKEKLVIDLSCRRSDDGWIVAMNRWQTPTEMAVDENTLDFLADRCDEFLIHAADVEGLCGGIDTELVSLLGGWGKIPVTYAGGARSLADLDSVNQLSSGRVDLTIGSALDIFGGDLIKYRDCVAYNS